MLGRISDFFRKPNLNPHQEAATEAKARAQAEAAARERLKKMRRIPLKGATEADIDASVGVLGESPVKGVSEEEINAAVGGLKDTSAVVGEAKEGSVEDWANAVKEFEKENK